MSANAYIQWSDIPAELLRTMAAGLDEATQANIVAFDGCPFVGEFKIASGKPIQIEYPLPRNPELRMQLIDWMLHWGLSFTVVA